MATNDSFGTFLAHMRTKKGLSQSQLAGCLGYSRKMITRWEVDNEFPSQKVILQVGSVLEASLEEINELLRLAGLRRLKRTSTILLPKAKEVSASIDLKTPSKELASQAILEMQVQVTDIQNSVDALSTETDEQVTNVSGRSTTFDEEIRNLRETVNRLKATSHEITAPVALPSSDEMTVRLVPVNLLERLEEYRFDEAKWAAIQGVFFGAVLSLVVNMATGVNATSSTWGLLGLLFAMACLASWATYSSRQRGNKVRNQLLGSSNSRMKLLKNETESSSSE